MNATTAALLLASGAIALWLAIRLRWLTRSGAVAAAVVGTAMTLGLGGPGLALLGFFFLSSSWLTRLARSASARAEREPVRDGDGGGRGAAQVLANAGVPAGAAALAALGWSGEAGIIAAGSLAAATADTWASEAGQWVGGSTRLITTGERVEPGRDGGVSWAGTAAGVAGSVGLAIVAVSVTASPLAPVAVAGVVAMLVDSVIGATLENRSDHVGNNTVNLIATLIGGLIALTLA